MKRKTKSSTRNHILNTMQCIDTKEAENLLTYSLRVAQTGNIVAARAVLRSLARLYPDYVHVWTALSKYAETPDEQHLALGRAIALDPENTIAHQRLKALRQTYAYLSPVPSSLPHTDEIPRNKPRRSQWLIAIVGMVILLLILFISINTSMVSLLFLLKSNAADSLSSSTARQTIAVQTPSMQPFPSPTVLPLGTLLEEDGWYVMLIRSIHTQVISGTIGPLQPRGHFVVVLLAIGNNTQTERRIPPGLFVLIDSQGQRYPPVAGASTTYLDVYGRGKYGDLSMEDTLPPHASMFSVPIIFDVPRDAKRLLLTVIGRKHEGWLIPEVLIEQPTPTPWSVYHGGRN